MAKNKPGFKLVVKDGDSTYNYNSKTGGYEYKTTDYVVESDDLGDILLQFLEYVTDNYNEDTVTLKYVPKKEKN